MFSENWLQPKELQLSQLYDYIGAKFNLSIADSQKIITFLKHCSLFIGFIKVIFEKTFKKLENFVAKAYCWISAGHNSWFSTDSYLKELINLQNGGPKLYLKLKKYF